MQQQTVTSTLGGKDKHVGFSMPKTPSSTGNYSKDCELGKCFYQEAVKYSVHNHLIFMRVIEGMILKGDVTGVEIGFLSSLSLDRQR